MKKWAMGTGGMRYERNDGTLCLGWFQVTVKTHLRRRTSDWSGVDLGGEEVKVLVLALVLNNWNPKKTVKGGS